MASPEEIAQLKAAAATAAAEAAQKEAEAAAARAAAAQAALDAAMAGQEVPAEPDAGAPVEATQAAAAEATRAAAAVPSAAPAAVDSAPLEGHAADVAAGYSHEGASLPLGALLVDGDPEPRAQVAIPLRMLNRHGLVAGATGTGKTTLLAALLGLVPATERLVCIEEASELRPNHPHVVHLQARSANVQSAGAVSLSDLVRAALRMRPDRIVLGEARGREVRDVLAALNTGHAGSWFTLHANSSADVPARLAALGALAGLDAGAVAVQAGAALDAVVFLRREDGHRWVAQLGRLTTTRDGTLVVDVVAEAARGAVRHGPGWEEFRARWAP